MEVEVIEVEFKGRTLTCKAVIRAIGFKQEEQKKLIEQILSNANTLLSAIDAVNDIDNSKTVEEAFEIVKEIVAEQHKAAVVIAAQEMKKVQAKMVAGGLTK